MNLASESSKLVELRAKTDRQLVELISNRAAAGEMLARLAAEAAVRQCHAKAELFEVQARKNYQEAQSLLPYVRGVAKGERRDLERKLMQLRESLDGLPVGGRMSVRAAS